MPCIFTVFHALLSDSYILKTWFFQEWWLSDFRPAWPWVGCATIRSWVSEGTQHGVDRFGLCFRVMNASSGPGEIMVLYEGSDYVCPVNVLSPVPRTVHGIRWAPMESWVSISFIW